VVSVLPTDQLCRANSIGETKVHKQWLAAGLCLRSSIAAIVYKALVFSSICLIIPSVAAGTEDARNHGLVDRLPGEDPTCDIVNRAYQNAQNHGRVSEFIFEVGPTSNSLWAEYRYIRRRSYDHKIEDYVWDTRPRPYLKTTENGRPIFTACQPVIDPAALPGTTEFSARWTRHGKSASATISISNGKIYRIERHFDPESSPFPFDAVVEILTDDPNLAAPIDQRPAPMDQSCNDVNEAFGKTIDTRRYSFTTTEAKNGVRKRLTVRARVIDDYLFSKFGGADWHRSNLPIDPLITPTGATFQNCVWKSGTALEIHYSGRWHYLDRTIPIDIWISSQTGKFTRTLRNYGDYGIKSNTVMQVFDYNPKNTRPPRQYIPDVNTIDLWSIIDGLQ
jgi:hypothetical protein